MARVLSPLCHACGRQKLHEGRGDQTGGGHWRSQNAPKSDRPLQRIHQGAPSTHPVACPCLRAQPSRTMGALGQNLAFAWAVGHGQCWERGEPEQNVSLRTTCAGHIKEKAPRGSPERWHKPEEWANRPMDLGVSHRDATDSQLCVSHSAVQAGAGRVSLYFSRWPHWTFPTHFSVSVVCH